MLTSLVNMALFLAKEWWKSRDFPDFPRIIKILTFFAKKWVKSFPIWILRPDLESSDQNTSDHAIFKCLVKSFIFGFIKGSIETFFASHIPKNDFLAKKSMTI